MVEPMEKLKAEEILEGKARRYRSVEFLFRVIGTGALALAIPVTALIAGDAANEGVEDVPGDVIVIDMLLLGGGIAISSQSQSYGRRADVVDAEILRRQAE